RTAFKASKITVLFMVFPLSIATLYVGARILQGTGIPKIKPFDSALNNLCLMSGTALVLQLFENLMPLCIRDQSSIPSIFQGSYPAFLSFQILHDLVFSIA
ncbi:unnamed protein product, partial [Heterosigma akashiwo]